MDRLLRRLIRGLRDGLRQGPALAGLWLLYGVMALAVCVPPLLASPLLWGQRMAVLLFLVFFVAAEATLLVLANGLLEAALAALPQRFRATRLTDGLKALALVAVTCLAGLSLLKLRVTGVHLKGSDLWFAWKNLRQLGAESLGTDRWAPLAVAAGALALAGALTLTLSRLRRGDAEPSARRTVLLTALLTLGAGATWTVYAPVRPFATHFLPEVHWGEQRLRAARLRGGVEAAATQADPRVLGGAIEAWEPPPARHSWNVVVVMLESIPWSRTTPGGGRPGITPNLDRLLEESLLFRRAYTTSTHSDYAQMAILSSLHPRKFLEHDYYTQIEYPRTLLWDALGPAGWQSAMFSCQNERWGNMIAFLDTPGLGLLRHSLDWPDARHKGRGSESKVYEETPVDAWRRWREASDAEPYLAYLNFQSNHFPYEVPPEAERPWAPWEIDFPASFLAFPREEVPVMLNRFYNALHYADRWLGEVATTLRRRGEWERTVLVVVSDHGEAFYEHDQPTHGTSLYEEQVRSLLAIRVPGGEGRVVDEPMSLLDVPPLLLGILGLPPHPNFQGRGDVLEPSYDGDARPLLFTIQGLTSEDGVLLDGWKYVVNWDRKTRRLMDLERDPEERRNLLEAEPQRAAALDGVLGELLRRQVTYYEGGLWREGRYPAPLP